MNKRILAITDITIELKHFVTGQNKIVNTKEFLLFAIWGHISNTCRAIDGLDFCRFETRRRRECCRKNSIYYHSRNGR